MIKYTSDYKIINIINDYKNIINDKNIVFSLLLRLKQSLEFNSTIDWNLLYTELGNLYKNQQPFYNSGKYTPDPIDKSEMSENDIFVFGSNTSGKHYGGAAKVAVKDYGAVLGNGYGIQGNSYAIATLNIEEQKPVELSEINRQINLLIDHALNNNDKTFWVTKIGTGITGYSISEISQLFANKIIPHNIILPIEFVSMQYHQEYLYSDKVKKFFKVKNNNHIIVVSVGNIKEITEVKINNVINTLPNDIVICDKDDFILASEQVLKELY